MLKKKYYDGIQVHSIITEELNNGELIMQILKRFADAPSADVRENVKGKWLKTRERNGFAMADCMECSACGHSFLLGDWDFEEAKDEMRFCYSCGADMRGEDDGK